jgi:glycosyltransferase involved in cell wall biosynthesis
MHMPDQQSSVFFSLIIPTYNRAGHIAKAIHSVLSQPFSDYEIIVIDDGSTDHTREVITAIAKTNSAIKYVMKKHEERSIARNHGVALASGKYIGFLDSDDIQYQNHLTVAYELLKRNSFPEVGHLGYELIDHAGNSLLIRNDFDTSSRDDLIHENKMHGNAIFIRKDVADQVHFIPSVFATVSEDWYVWLRLAARYPFHFDNAVTSAVVQHNDRSLNKIDPDKLIASTEVVIEYLKGDNLFLTYYHGHISYHFANHYTLVALVLALTKSRRLDTVKYLMKAICCDPKVILRRRFLASVKYLL